MKHIKLAANFAIASLALVFLTGCPANDDSPEVVTPQEDSADAPQEETQREAPEPEGEEMRIVITGDDRMQFDVTEFEVHPRQPVTIVFENVGTMPKESMGHNLVVLEQGVEALDFASAGAQNVRNEYIDPEREDEIIAGTAILGPDESEEISFVAPAETGENDYVCTFPGHAQAGMVGVMIVREE